jgi:hypothetical protein
MITCANFHSDADSMIRVWLAAKLQRLLQGFGRFNFGFAHFLWPSTS